MEKEDLSLVSIDNLIGEIKSRCHTFICAYAPIDFQTKEDFKFYYRHGSWHTATALSNILNNDVLNNWSGELETLQKINSEERGNDD